MAKLEILCATMHQKDFSLVEKMNIKCDAVIANQTDSTEFQSKNFEWGSVKMISTQTRGIGKNRNLSLLYASGDILLLADDDMHYTDTCVKDILAEFERFPKADVIIFNIQSNSENRKQKQNKKSKRTHQFNRMPYGSPRIAFRKSSWEKSAIWFTSLFGPGTKYSIGEDSLFLRELQKKRLKIYVSNIFIGTVNMDQSSWFKGRNEEFFFNRGAYLEAFYPFTFWLWKYYYALRLKSELNIKQRLFWIQQGRLNFKNGKSYKDLEKQL